MMKLLLPLGLLGLLSIVALIIIYIIKPNYEQKFISSTYVWQLSLKYRKQKLPVSKLRNLLIFLAQLLIFTLCAFILAYPVIQADGPENYDEKIFIIDASASMRAEDGIESRFERAVDMVIAASNEVLNDDGVVSVILAGREASVLIQRADKQKLLEVEQTLTDLIMNDACSYGKADIDGAMLLAESVLAINPNSEVRLYTATEYIDDGKVTVVDVKADGEWNAAILNASAKVNERLFYTYSIDLAVYGRDADISLVLEIYGANATSENPAGSTVVIEQDVLGLNNGETMTVTVDTGNYRSEDADDYVMSDDDRSIMSYDYVYIYIKSVNNVDLTSIADSIDADNKYYIYGGKKPTLRLQYVSWRANPFIETIISDWRSTLSPKWNLSVTPIPDGGEFAEEGFDVYIFEHIMPKHLPDDGLVIFFDPPAPNDNNKEEGYLYTEAPSDLGLTFGNRISAPKGTSYKFAAGETSPITAKVIPEEIEVTDYTPVVNTSGEYKELLYCENGSISDPILLVKNNENEKVMVFSASVHASTISILFRFPPMMLAAFNYFFPATTEKYNYEIGDTAYFDSVGSSLYLTGPTEDIKEEYAVLPSSLMLEIPGRYILTQQMFPASSRPTTITTYFYVKMPWEESNTERVKDALTNPYSDKKEEYVDLDLLIYFAAAMLVLLVAERLLYSREQI